MYPFAEPRWVDIVDTTFNVSPVNPAGNSAEGVADSSLQIEADGNICSLFLLVWIVYVV